MFDMVHLPVEDRGVLLIEILAAADEALPMVGDFRQGSFPRLRIKAEQRDQVTDSQKSGAHYGFLVTIFGFSRGFS